MEEDTQPKKKQRVFEIQTTPERSPIPMKEDINEELEGDKTPKENNTQNNLTPSRISNSPNGDSTPKYETNSFLNGNDQEYPDTNPDEKKKPLSRYLPHIYGCRHVDNFKKLNLVEEGTYGVVFRAQDTSTGEVVALKKVKMEREKEGFPITSLREISILMVHHHPNVVDVKEIAVGEKDAIFIVMEFLEHDLKQLITEMKSSQRFMISEVKCLMKQFLEGVAFLHENWIIHRDLKTSNLLYSNKGVLKIADFGLAREYGSPLKPYTQMVVTQWYRAPELLLGCKEYSTAIDMWSVGCIFAEILTKEALLPGRSELDQLDRIFKLLGTPSEKIWPGFKQLPAAKTCNFKKYPYVTLREKLPSVTNHCYDLLLRMLCYDPSKRITAMEALNHPFFEEKPRAVEPCMMTTWPSSHDGTKKKRDSMDEEELKQRLIQEEKNAKARFQGMRDKAQYGFNLRK